MVSAGNSGQFFSFSLRSCTNLLIKFFVTGYFVHLDILCMTIMHIFEFFWNESDKHLEKVPVILLFGITFSGTNSGQD